MDKRDQRGFYIVIPSNVQPELHASNTASSFQTTFPNSYNLMGEWEVALTEMSYVNTIPTIVDESFSIDSSRLNINKNKKYTFAVEVISLQPTKKGEREITFNKFTAVHPDCPFDVVHNPLDNRFEIRAVKDDVPPNIYLSRLESNLMKLAHPAGRWLEGGIYRQLWMDTLKKDSVYKSFENPTLLVGRSTIDFWVKSTECLTVSVPKGYYPTPEKLVEALNRETKHPLADWEESVRTGGKSACGYRFAYNANENRIVLGLAQFTDLTFHGNLHSLLGFNNNHYGEREQTADHAPLMNQGIYHIYIYCDLCAPIRVGNALVPLLRAVDVPPSNWGQVRSTRFTRPMYIPIDKSTFYSIKVELYDDTGRPISFREGRTVITLHLRPRRL